MNKFTRPRRKNKQSDIWQIVYMDMMTIVMAFFVILWTVSQGKESGVSEKVGDQTTRMLSLPSDVLFPAGKSKLIPEGKAVFGKLFGDPTGGVLDFDTGGLTKRLLVVHGHTDADGDKQENFKLGYERAYAAYREIAQFNTQVADHVILCSHANNSPARETPDFQGEVTPAQQAVLRDAKAKNRRIQIEDKIVSAVEER